MVSISAGLIQASLRIRQYLTSAEGWWFDFTRRVQTSGYVKHSGFTLAGNAKSGYEYLPVRPSRARAVLRDLPIRNYSDYAFVDLGSGKGRMLLVAAEFPFSSIRGVEFALELHQEAATNIERCVRRRQRNVRIESINVDAADYDFPAENLVVYLYNPIGTDVIRKVLQNLQSSVMRNPRHVVLLMLGSEFCWLPDGMSWLLPYKKNRRYQIYQTHSISGRNPVEGQNELRSLRRGF